MNNIFQPGTVKPEEDYLEMERLGSALGIPVPMVHVSVEVRQPDGSVETVTDRSRTFNRNFWNWLLKSFGCMPGQIPASLFSSDASFGAGHITNKTTGGSVINADAAYTSNPGHYNMDLITSATIGVDTIGIVVGTGSAAEDFENYMLGTKIAHGTSSGQMTYNAAAFNQPAYNAGTKVWTSTISRVFNNNSGGTISVAETGMYPIHNGAGATKFMTCRDLLSSPISVFNGGQLTVTYTLTLTFPA